MTNSDADKQLIDVLEQALPQARRWLEYWERQEESANTKNFQARFSGRPHTPLPEPMSIPIGAVLEIPDVEASVKYEEGVSSRSRTIHRTIMAFTLFKKAAPVVGKSWIDFVDDELQAVEWGQLWAIAMYEGELPRIPPAGSPL
jgi:hypothetical protein